MSRKILLLALLSLGASVSAWASSEAVSGANLAKDLDCYFEGPTASGWLFRDGKPNGGQYIVPGNLRAQWHELKNGVIVVEGAGKSTIGIVLQGWNAGSFYGVMMGMGAISDQKAIEKMELDDLLISDVDTQKQAAALFTSYVNTTGRIPRDANRNMDASVMFMSSSLFSKQAYSVSCTWRANSL